MLNLTKQNCFVHLPLIEQIQHSPDKIFLTAEQSISYSEAGTWIANCMRYIEQSERVSIWMNKGNNYALTVLSTLFCGSTYIPLDGAQPVQRVQKILEDSESETLVTDEVHFRNMVGLKLPNSLKKIIIIGDMEPVSCCINVEIFNPKAMEHIELHAKKLTVYNLNDTAAILYTSGSTGNPKGVQLSHRNLSNFISWAKTNLNVSSDDSFINIANFNFDLSTFDLFLPIAVGASLYVTNEKEQGNLAKLASILNDNHISVIYTVPTLLRMMNRINLWTMPCVDSLRLIIFAGEVMPMPQLKSMMNQLKKNIDVYNFYGPTETNVCLYHQVQESDLLLESLPIGKPIDGAVVELRNNDNNPIDAFGELGQIWVSGDCVTPGYWNRKDPNNFNNHQDGWHATGDFGSYDQGLMFYRGRMDRMVKLNGYRIELGEIESVINRHPDVEEVAVLVIEERNEKRIKAFISFHDDRHKLSLSSLKEFCSQHLPSYMIPHKLEVRYALEKNANGKIDYKTLSTLSESR